MQGRLAGASLAALVIAAALLAYAPALRGEFLWDDEDYVEGNQTLRSTEGLRQIWFDPTANTQYYPLTYSSLWLDYHLWELRPFGYHLANVLLHAAGALLLWRVLRALAIPGALLIAFLFALHPVHVESVAWITERKNVLSGVLYFAAILAWLRSMPLTGERRSALSRWGFYALALVLFVGALLAKTTTCTLPAVLLILIWWKRGRVERRELLALAPLFVLGAVFALATAWLEVAQVGSEEGELELGWIERFLIAGRALWFYAGKLAWPEPLVFVYPRWEIDRAAWWQYLYPLAAIALVLTLWLARGRLGRGPLACVLMFSCTLLPALGFFHVYYMRYSFVADHFQYLASVALLVLVGAAWARWTETLEGRWRDASRTAMALVCTAFAVLVWRQSHAYQSRETLWRDVIAKNPTAWIAFNNLGYELARAGKPAQALPYIQHAIALKEDYYEAYGNLADTYTALGRPEMAERVYLFVAELARKKLEGNPAGPATADGVSPSSPEEVAPPGPSDL